MNIKKLFSITLFLLLASPWSYADEIGSGFDCPDRCATTTSTDEIGSGLPEGTQSTNGDVEAALAWWTLFIQSL